jgi:hypothetical protein
VYFGLAALPIFGLGQALIDPADTARRAGTFFLMTVYIVSSLGLLVTTAFLGLRRYLRHRRLEMPKLVTSAWLSLGAILIAVLAAIGAILPRPYGVFTSVNFAPARSEENAASEHARTRGDPGTGKGRPGAEKKDADDTKDQTSRANAKEPSKQEGDGNKEQAGKAASKDSAAKNTENSKDGANEAPSENAPDLSPVYETLAALKKFVFAILALITAFFILRGGLKYLANFCDWARRLLDALRRFWEGLFSGIQRAISQDGDAETFVTPSLPFSAFSNPFSSGAAQTMKPSDLVRYSFEALEAWAEERAHGREAEETPLEFTDRLAVEVGSLDKETTQLGSLYARVLYARGALPPDWRSSLERFWQRLEMMPGRKEEPAMGGRG